MHTKFDIYYYYSQFHRKKKIDFYKKEQKDRTDESIVWPSSIYGFWLPPFCIFKHFLHNSQLTFI
jgi:hypothetical protein